MIDASDAAQNDCRHSILASRAKAHSLNFSLLDTDALGEAEQVVSTNYGHIRMATHHSDTYARAHRAFVRRVDEHDGAEFGHTFSYSMAPPEKILLLARIHSGTMELGREHGPPELVGPGGVVEQHGALLRERFSGTCHRGHWDTFLIDSAFSGHVAGGPPHADGPTRLTGSVPVSATATEISRGDGLCA